MDLARKRAAVFGLADRIRFCAGNAEQLSAFVPPERYDLIYSFGVIHHTPHPDRIIDQVRRNYLKPGGTFKVMVYHRNSWKVMGVLVTEARGAVWRLDEAIARNSEAQTGCPITYAYRRSDVPRLMTGFELDDVFVEHIFPYRVADYVQYRYVKAIPFRWLPDNVMRALRRALGWHLCITARLPGMSEI